MISLTCDICQEDQTLDNFLFEPACGHGFCTTCTESTNTRTSCPLCRKPKVKKVPPHRVYITPSSNSGATIEDQAASLSNALSMLDTNSPPQHFQNAASKMKAVVEGVDGNGTIASHLLASARNMEDRLAYFAHHVQMERDEKGALQQKVNMWHSRVLQADALARENKCLKANAREAQRDIARLQTENNKLGRVVNGLKAEGERICGVEKVVEEKDRIIEELRGQIEEAKKENRLMKRKLKALSSSKPSRKRAVADPNDSLLVDYSNTVS